MRYTNQGELVLDQFLGGGTTLVEAKILNRNAIGVDINPHAIAFSAKKLDFNCDSNSVINMHCGDAAELNILENESIDFNCMHPPYANIIKYSNNLEGDISLLSIEDFIIKMSNIAKESYRVLKKGKYCAVMIGDVRKFGRVIPLGFQVMSAFLDQGFKSKEIIIKEQHNCRKTNYWNKRNVDFLLLAHEYIFVFQK